MLVDTDISSGDSYLRYRIKRRSFSYHRHPIAIDDGLSSVLISTTTKYYGDARRATLTTPDGKTVKPTTSLHLASVFELRSPQPGIWNLNFPPYVKKYTFMAKGISKDPIQFAYNYIYQKDADNNSPPYTLTDPIKGI